MAKVKVKVSMSRTLDLERSGLQRQRDAERDNEFVCQVCGGELDIEGAFDVSEYEMHIDEEGQINVKVNSVEIDYIYALHCGSCGRMNEQTGWAVKSNGLSFWLKRQGPPQGGCDHAN